MLNKVTFKISLKMTAWVIYIDQRVSKWIRCINKPLNRKLASNTPKAIVICQNSIPLHIPRRERDKRKILPHFSFSHI